MITSHEQRRGRSAWPALLVGGLVLAAVSTLVVLSFRRGLARSRMDACKGLDPVFVHRRLPANPLTKLTAGPRGLVPGDSLALEGLAEGTYLLNFWSATCAPCVRELPSLVELGRRAWPGAVLLVCLDDSIDEASRLVAENSGLLSGQGNVLWLWDKGGALARKMGTTKVPETYFVSHGEIRWKVESDRDWMSMPARRCLRTSR